MAASTESLYRGIKGTSVAALHSDLDELGLGVPEDERNRAEFGEGTEQRIREFQRERGLRETGVIDPETAEHLTRSVVPFYIVEGRLLSRATAAKGKIRVVVASGCRAIRCHRLRSRPVCRSSKRPQRDQPCGPGSAH